MSTGTSAGESGSSRHIGVVGLAVMGENLALNIVSRGYPIAVYNRTSSRTEEFLTTRTVDHDIVGATTIEAFVDLLESPRQIIITVKAGKPVDAVLQELTPFLNADDIVIDGGNSFFGDTDRRTTETAGAFQFVGMGISGGEEGALHGPSLMPGGPEAAWQILKPMLVAISAKTEAGPCVTHIGPGGSGHYVKMVHNGIEYGDMQLIAETYDIMRRGLSMTAEAIGQVFARWNEGKLASFLIEMTAEVLAVRDIESGEALVDLILDTAEQKGTGRWTSQNALELGTPVPTIDAAVGARSMSSRKDERVAASAILTGPTPPEHELDKTQTLIDLENALYFAKISSYAQGMALLQAASREYGWDLNLAEIARIWKGGCIIRARLLDPIRAAYSENPTLVNLLLAPEMSVAINDNGNAIRTVLVAAVQRGIPVTALSAALNYVDSYRCALLPANLIQALRDDFGAHTYRRLDQPGVFHTNWTTGETTKIV